jgi:dienelactone hydrolase
MYVGGSNFDLLIEHTDVTGPINDAEATTAILSIYDAFGYFPQTQQGADIVSAALTSAGEPTVVIMPDFFRGNAIPLEWYPPDTDEKRAGVAEWFKTALPPLHIPKLPGIIAAAEQAFPRVKTWGVLGYCWGGKMASLLSAQQARIPETAEQQQPQQTFKAAVQLHPGLIDPSEAAEIVIPTCMLASMDEDVDEVKGYDAALTKAKVKHVETFTDQVHGWMSARADLKDDRVRAEYERGYQIVVKFFSENLWEET